MLTVSAQIAQVSQTVVVVFIALLRPNLAV